jgi:hypothetical protein
MTTDPRIAALAEALASSGVGCATQTCPEHSSKDHAAAILAALDGAGWRLHARDKMCPHEVEITRLRKIEEAARKLMEAPASHPEYAFAALRAALEAER